MLGHMFQAQSPQASSSLFHLRFYKEETGHLLFACNGQTCNGQGKQHFHA